MIVGFNIVISAAWVYEYLSQIHLLHSIEVSQAACILHALLGVTSLIYDYFLLISVDPVVIVEDYAMTATSVHVKHNLHTNIATLTLNVNSRLPGIIMQYNTVTALIRPLNDQSGERKKLRHKSKRGNTGLVLEQCHIFDGSFVRLKY